MHISKYYRAVLRMPLNLVSRKRLIHKDFSILCNNCVGGVILHELGMPFLSPTVNLYILPEDYLRMLGDLRRYLCEESLTQDIEESERVGYPVGLLGDVRLWFVHYASFEEASKKWKERCARVRWDHLYIMMIERDGCTEDNIRMFDQLPYEHKVIFTAKEYPDIESAYCIPGSSEDNGQVMDLCRYRGAFTGRRWIDMFDYVGFLNKGNKTVFKGNKQQ